MPSGKTHDAATMILAAPTFLAAWALTGSLFLAALTTGAMLFGGFMFGPDLDIQSRQYTRWGFFRIIWFPYRVVFRHRSRFSHGLIFGTLIRVIYFTGVLVVVALCLFYLRAVLASGGPPDFDEIARTMRGIEAGIRQTVGWPVIWSVLAGLWWGAATHTLLDVFWSILKKGSEIF